MKRIAFLITSNGVDGRGSESIDHAYWDEDQRDEAFGKIKATERNYYRKSDRIVEDDKDAVLKKLNALDRLILGI